MNRPIVYVSGPLTSSGTLDDNVHNAVVAARQLIGHGFAPIVPHLSVYIDPTNNYGHRRWIEIDKALVSRSDAVLRLPGGSVGADEECEYARQHGIPVFTDILSLSESLGQDMLDSAWPEQEQTNASNDPIIAMFEGMHSDLSGHQPHPDSRRFYELLTEMATVHAQKQADYGRAGNPFFNVRSSTEWGMPAWIGAMVRANDKIRRLQKFAQSGELANESAYDSLIDLANYAIIALVLMEAQYQDEPEPLFFPDMTAFGPGTDWASNYEEDVNGPYGAPSNITPIDIRRESTIS